MKIKRATGYARFYKPSQAGLYAKARLEEGLKVSVKFDGEMYRVDFEPDENIKEE